MTPEQLHTVHAQVQAEAKADGPISNPRRSKELLVVRLVVCLMLLQAAGGRLLHVGIIAYRLVGILG